MKTNGNEEPNEVIRVEEHGYIPLTPYQSTFYKEWLLNPVCSEYNIVMDSVVSGNLIPQRAIAAVRKLFEQNFIFAYKVVNEEKGFFWKKRDIEEFEKVGIYHNEKLTDKELYEIVSRPFDLEKDVLFRLDIINLGEDRYRIIIVMHHLVVDGVSTHEIYTQWIEIYNKGFFEAESLEEQVVLQQELSSYFETILSDHKERFNDFWKEHLQGVEGADLSFLKKKTNIPSTSKNVGEMLFSYDEDIYQKVRALKNPYRLTPYIYGKLIFGILLHKITGQNNIGIPYPIAILEGKDLFYGAHVNTLIIDFRINEEATVEGLIEQTLTFYKELKKSKSKYLPVSDIIRYADDKNVLEIGFAQTFLRDEVLSFNEVKHEKSNHEFQIDLPATLLFEQEQHNNKLNYRVRYDRNVIDENRLTLFIEMYKKLFAEILTDLSAEKEELHLLSSYELLTVPQKENILSQWNHSRKEYPHDKTVVELFEKQADEVPDNLAVVYKDHKLTYRELNERSNQLADYLRHNYNIQPDTLVVLCMERSTDMLVSLLGILKSGAAYVPVDPNAPDKRIIHIMEETQAGLLIANRTLKEKVLSVTSSGNAGVLLIDEETTQKMLDDYSTSNSASTDSGNLAYVIYTSGTTGQPKGVMIEHKGVVNLALMQGEKFGLETSGGNSEYKNCMWFSSFVFDAHASELYTAIVNGHTIYIIEDEKRSDIHLLNEYIQKNQISIATVPPALLNKKVILNLSTLVVAGDITGSEIMDEYIGKGIQVINAYGPTEATVCSTLHDYRKGNSNTNIGRALDNVTAYILDKDMNLLPVGAIGELYIGGDGVARGYLNNKVLTAEKFVPNPYQTESEKQEKYNSKLYKTGDLVRHLENGEIEYIGRNDFQVKIRGFRIELSEIETVISSHKDVKQAVVLAKALSNKNKYLVGYYVADKELSHTVLTDYLNQLLPEYMVPAIFVHLEKLPITINGKIDRNALPDPGLFNNQNYQEPENREEKILCEVYAGVLGLDKANVGVEDDFFKLGGDSITSIQLTNEIRKKLGVHVPVKDIFENRTIRLLSNHIISLADEGKQSILSE
ncbi:non-ribosomal peptide synthetase [Chryseobacterium sp.]|uniref:non-ribosomal peptide synthetase n=1 Tax=Chryseobacterium sp. TaxID=1871047 RepID=UPI0025C686F9|nr:non-ribosomal peptide synthetase [Chryseobacterium sp.]